MLPENDSITTYCPIALAVHASSIAPDVSTSGRWGGAEANKFEQVSSLGHHMSVRTSFNRSPVLATICQYQWGDPQVNKFEQVFSLDNEMSLAGVPYTVRSHAQSGGQGPCTVRSNASWVMVTCRVCGQTRLKASRSRNFGGR